MSDQPQTLKNQETLREKPNKEKEKKDPISSAKQILIDGGVEIGEGWKELEQKHEEANTMIADLDSKLNKVLRKQEYEYLQAYNIYVKRKEKELHDLIQALYEKNKGSSFKETRISNLELTVKQLREKANADEREMEALRKDGKIWKEKLYRFKVSRKF